MRRATTFRPVIEFVETRRFLSITPTVDVSVFSSNALRDTHKNGIIVVTRRDSLADDLTVPLSIGGTAANGVDYGRVGDVVTIPAGQRSIAIPIRATQSSDAAQYVTVTIGKVSGYSTTNRSALVDIKDNAAAADPIIEHVTLTQNAVGRFVLTRTGSTADTLTVPLDVGGTAVNGVDFGRIGDEVTFTPGESTVLLNVRTASNINSSGGTLNLSLADLSNSTTTTSTDTTSSGLTIISGGSILGTGLPASTPTDLTGSGASGSIDDLPTTVGTISAGSSGAGTAIGTGLSPITDTSTATSTTGPDAGGSAVGSIGAGGSSLGSVSTTVGSTGSMGSVLNSTGIDDGLFTSVPTTATDASTVTGGTFTGTITP